MIQTCDVEVGTRVILCSEGMANAVTRGHVVEIFPSDESVIVELDGETTTRWRVPLEWLDGQTVFASLIPANWMPPWDGEWDYTWRTGMYFVLTDREPIQAKENGQVTF